MGFFEVLVIAVIGLLVFGPEKLPEAIRTFAFGLSKAKRTWQNTRRELEQELGMDEIRREIHNAQIMENLDKTKDISLQKKLAQESTEQQSAVQDSESNLGEHVDDHQAMESHSKASDQSEPNQPESDQSNPISQAEPAKKDSD